MNYSELNKTQKIRIGIGIFVLLMLLLGLISGCTTTNQSVGFLEMDENGDLIVSPPISDGDDDDDDDDDPVVVPLPMPPVDPQPQTNQ